MEPSVDTGPVGRPEETSDCCAAWADALSLFDWYSLEDHPDLLIMPYFFRSRKRHWRVNYCPSCGANRRDVVVTSWRVDG